MAQNVLEVNNLIKTYKNYTAVDRVSFVVPKGKIIGLLGPNGAGKTTTIQMLMGVTIPNGGTISYFGKKFDEHRQNILQRINFTSSFNTLQGRISAEENLHVFAVLYGVKNPRKKIAELAEYFEITEVLKTRYWDLSAGQKTRVNLVKSLINDPELILMDEPTASLDPDIGDKTLTLIEKLNKERGLSILYTSHEMDEVTRICDEVVFMDRGKVVAQDTPQGLTKRLVHAEIFLTIEKNMNLVEKYLQKEKVEYNLTHKNNIHIKTEEKLVPSVIFGISNLGISITDIEVRKSTLEDFFVQLARGGFNAS